MDPIATLRRLAEALELQDWAEAKEAARDLSGWLSRGGFVPTGEAAKRDWAFVLLVYADR